MYRDRGKDNRFERSKLDGIPSLIFTCLHGGERDIIQIRLL